MNNDNLGGISTSGVSIDASAPEQDSSPESNTQPDLLKNMKAEMNRKVSKLDEKVERIIRALESNQSRASTAEVEPTADEPDSVKKYIDARFNETQFEQVRRGQEENWSKALQMFPELNQDSDQFDESFYKMADKYYGSFDLKKDPEAPMKAAKLAAVELGKIEQLTRSKLLNDEARRSRIIAEGGSGSRDQRNKEREPQLNERNLARLGIKADKLKARIKADKEKYGE